MRTSRENRLVVSPVLVLLFGLLVCGVSALCSAANCESVIVTGAGIEAVNGTYDYGRESNGKPLYVKGSNYYVRWQASVASWQICSKTEVFYEVLSSADTPPISGWACAENGDLPIPSVQGGSCPSEADPWDYYPAFGNGATRTGLSLTPEEQEVHDSLVGSGGFCFGGVSFFYFYNVGDIIRGGSRILGENELPISTGYVIAELYTYVLASRAGAFYPAVLEPNQLLHDVVSFDRESREYRFEYDTAHLLPGFYLIYLAYPDGFSERFPFVLNAPSLDLGTDNIEAGLDTILDAATELSDSLVGGR
ncbi:hypothetical protein KKG90_09555 [Candidatus Bipolaricaulota bacterium]|nr:hypothetical protein [Candidatus Bipolaricaulota bacterium]